MGTRADFYVGRGKQAEWLGSIAWDGYPDGIPKKILRAKNEAVYREAVEKFIQERDDGTKPRDGWPWPWEDSGTTDYSYAFDGECVYGSSFGHAWFDPTKSEERQAKKLEGQPDAVFPDMKNRQSVTLGKRSGVLIVSA